VPGESLGPVALFAAERYAGQRHAMLILDPSNEWTSMTEVVRTQRARPFPSANALTYFPMLENPPDVPLPGPLSAAGAIAGLLAAGDEHAGPWSLPGECMPLALGRSRPIMTLDDGEIAQLRRLGVNAVARLNPPRVELHGPVTLARFGGVANSWNDLRVRRSALFILGSIARYTRWAAFEEADAALWAEVREQVEEFLTAVHQRGGLAGERTRDAFYVKCDADNNTRSIGPGSRLEISVGLALEHPKHYLSFHICNSAREVTVEELGWPPGLALAG
jgi:phage tail sheath protein FI